MMRGSVQLTVRINNPGEPFREFSETIQMSDRVQIGQGMEDALMGEIWSIFHDRLDGMMRRGA